MNNINLGYACINMQLSCPQQWGNQPRGVERITTNRTMIRRTFVERGLPYASELALKNCIDLLKILQWNEAHDIKFFRLTSNMFPWASEYKLSDLPDFNAIRDALQAAGDFIRLHEHRVTSHPGPFNKLTSPDERVILNTVRDLDHHGEVFDHHTFCTGDLDQAEALLTAAMTWGDIKPVVHYSQSRSVEHNDSKIRANAHSDSYWTPVDTHGLNVDVMLECKHKELGLYAMRELLTEKLK